MKPNRKNISKQNQKDQFKVKLNLYFKNKFNLN